MTLGATIALTLKHSGLKSFLVYSEKNIGESMNKLIDFLNELEDKKIPYNLAKYCDEYIMVEISVPGERWEVEISPDDVRIEKFKSDGTLFDESELKDLFARFST